jgi:hypothetical protein
MNRAWGVSGDVGKHDTKSRLPDGAFFGIAPRGGGSGTIGLVAVPRVSELRGLPWRIVFFLSGGRR